MGSMKKRPTAPPVQRVTYVVQQPVYTESSFSGSDGEADVPELSEEQQEAQRRSENLLRRTRGRLGTVLTGFRGILSPSENSGQRKTLLGE